MKTSFNPLFATTLTLAAQLALTPAVQAQTAPTADVARCAGQLLGEDSGSFCLSPLPAAAFVARDADRSTLARVQAARAGGEARCAGQMIGEDSGSICLSGLPVTSVISRQVVLALLAQARRSGELQAMQGEDSGSMWMARQQWADRAIRYAGPNVGDASTGDLANPA